MKIKINGKEHNFESSCKLSQVIQNLGINSDSIAIALNWSVVPKRDLEKITIEDGDTIEIIRAVAGG